MRQARLGADRVNAYATTCPAITRADKFFHNGRPPCALVALSRGHPASAYD